MPSQRLKSTKRPIVLTLGRPEPVVHDASSYQYLLDRLEEYKLALRAANLESMNGS